MPLLAKKIFERHAFLSSTIGVMNIEQVSYDNTTSLFYVATVVFPFLTMLELCVYLLYQYKVKFNILVFTIKQNQIFSFILGFKSFLISQKNTMARMNRRKWKWNELKLRQSEDPGFLN